MAGQCRVLSCTWRIDGVERRAAVKRGVDQSRESRCRVDGIWRRHENERDERPPGRRRKPSERRLLLYLGPTHKCITDRSFGIARIQSSTVESNRTYRRNAIEIMSEDAESMVELLDETDPERQASRCRSPCKAMRGKRENTKRGRSVRVQKRERSGSAVAPVGRERRSARVAEQHAVDGSVDRRLARREVHPEALLQSLAHAALRDRVEVRAAEELLHGALEVRVGRPTERGLRLWARRVRDRHVEVVRCGPHGRGRVEAPGVAHRAQRRVRERTGDRGRAVRRVPSGRIFGRRRVRGARPAERRRRRPARLVVRLAPVHGRGRRRRVPLVLELLWRNPRAEAVVGLLVPELVFLQRSSSTEVQASSDSALT
jgi:hypothetical protein